jgi:hypothetical protein
LNQLAEGKVRKLGPRAKLKNWILAPAGVEVKTNKQHTLLRREYHCQSNISHLRIDERPLTEIMEDERNETNPNNVTNSDDDGDKEIDSSSRREDSNNSDKAGDDDEDSEIMEVEESLSAAVLGPEIR